MNINTIKVNINNIKGQKLKFKYNGSRKQTEVFNGTIENTYNSIFTVRLSEDDRIRTFTYADVLTDSLEILSKK